MASFLDTTLVTSTVVVDAVPCAFGALAEQAEFEPQELHKQTPPARTRLDRTLIRLIEPLQSRDADSAAPRSRTRFGVTQGPVTAIALELAPEIWKPPDAASVVTQR